MAHKNESVQRLFSAEGALHLFSSLPTVLMPADIYLLKENQNIKDAILDCNIYLITTRRRILIDYDGISVKGNILSGYFLVLRKANMVRIPFQYTITTEYIGNNVEIEGVRVSPFGLSVDIITNKGQVHLMSHVILATAVSTLTFEDQDLEVLYIGQGIGRSTKRTAVDRLLNHSTFQRILAEVTTFNPENEIILLLYRFEHQSTFASTGGDLNAEPKASMEDEFQHLKRIHHVQFNRKGIVTLAEAALIRYFQPSFNIQLKNTNFTSQNKIKILSRLLNKDITGIIVEICSGNVKARLHTKNTTFIDMSKFLTPAQYNGDYLNTEALKQEWAESLHLINHTHYAQFPLTTPSERDNFLHGTIQYGETERKNHIF